MRYSRISWLTDDNGLVGFYLQGEYCGEHERGIARLQSIFGVTDLPLKDGLPIEGVLGIERRIATCVPKTMFYGTYFDQSRIRQKRCESLIIDPYSIHSKRSNLDLSTDKVSAAWSDSDLGIIAAVAEDKRNLARIYEAILNLDVALWIGGGTENVFDRPGLTFVIASRCSEENKNTLLQSDLERKRISDADLATGIRDRIRAADRIVLDLRPSDNDMFPESAHPVKYWAQVMDNSYSSCAAKYVSVEHLDQWLVNEGPLMHPQP